MTDPGERTWLRAARRCQSGGVLLAQSRGPIDPTASVKRGVFSAGDTWISTEYLFRRDEDGDYWLMGRRGSVVVTARGLVYPEAVTDALGFIDGVDLAATYNVAGRRSGGGGVA